jgi:hypothetical protein
MSYDKIGIADYKEKFFLIQILSLMAFATQQAISSGMQS